MTMSVLKHVASIPGGSKTFVLEELHLLYSGILVKVHYPNDLHFL